MWGRWTSYDQGNDRVAPTIYDMTEGNDRVAKYDVDDVENDGEATWSDELLV